MTEPRRLHEHAPTGQPFARRANPLAVSVVTMTERFRENRRGILWVDAYGPDGARLCIDQPPGNRSAPQRTSITLTGAQKITGLVEQLRALADALEQVTDVNGWRELEIPAEPVDGGPRDPYWWQQYGT